METSIIILMITFILTSITLAFIPYMTRKTENFGVSIPEELFDRADFQSMRKRYTWNLLASGILFALFIISGSFFMGEKMLYIMTTILLLVFIIASFLIYLPFHFKMKKMKQAEKWYIDKPQTIVVDTKFREEKLILSNWWFMIPGMISIKTIAITFIFYDKIPGQIPMHTDFAGNVRYDEKTWSNLLFLPGTNLFLLLMFIGINLVIKYSKQQVSAQSPATSKQRNILFRRRWSGYMIAIATLTALLFFYIQFSFIDPGLERYIDMIIIIYTVTVILGTLLLAFLTGQGGSRIKLDHSSEHGMIDRDDDRYWKLGQFYVNRHDPSIFIEKRFGVGWTNNWAHPLSWILIIGVIAIPIIITFILM